MEDLLTMMAMMMVVTPPIFLMCPNMIGKGTRKERKRGATTTSSPTLLLFQRSHVVCHVLLTGLLLEVIALFAAVLTQSLTVLCFAVTVVRYV